MKRVADMRFVSMARKADTPIRARCVAVLRMEWRKWVLDWGGVDLSGMEDTIFEMME